MNNTFAKTKFDSAILSKQISVGKVKTSEIKGAGEFPVIDQSQNFIAGYWDDKDEVYTGQLPVILFGDHTRTFKFIDFPFVTGADGVKVLVPNTELFDPKYLYYACTNLDIPNRGYNRHHKLLKEQDIPTPPLEEQKKIAAVLSTVQNAIEKNNSLLSSVRRMKQSLLNSAFTSNGELVELSSVLETDYGYTESANEEPIGPRFLRITDIDDYGVVDWDSVPFCKIDDADFAKNKLEKDDIVVARIGATTGKTAYINNNVDAVFASYLIRLRVMADCEILPKYIYYFTQSDMYWSQLEQRKEGKLKKGVNSRELKTLMMPRLTIDKQRELIESLNTVDASINAIVNKLSKEEFLFNSLLENLMSAEIRVNDLDIDYE